MTVTIKDHWDQIKTKVYNNSPSAVTQLDAIWDAVQALDGYNSGSEHIQPMADEVVHLIWNLHGCPEEEHDWPVPPPPPEGGAGNDELATRGKTKTRGKQPHEYG